MFRQFNFAHEPFRNARLPRLIFASVAALTLLITVIHGAILANYLLRESEDVDEQVETLRQELRETEATIADARSTLQEETSQLRGERTRFLSRLYRRKGFSWTGLFNELEEITPAAVRITSITPAEDEGEITVNMSLVGRELPSVIEMVRALEGSDIFDAVFPLDEVELDADQGGGVAATLNLTYIEKQAETEAQDETQQPSSSEDDDSVVDDENEDGESESSQDGEQGDDEVDATPTEETEETATPESTDSEQSAPQGDDEDSLVPPNGPEEDEVTPPAKPPGKRPPPSSSGDVR